MNNIICLKYGTKYSSEYVNKLYNMTKRFCSLPHRFVCFTDDASNINKNIETKPLLCDYKNIIGWWHKLCFFQEKLYDLEGTLLYLDLDIVIVNQIDKFFYYEGDFLAIWDWIDGVDKNVFNSSVMRWQLGTKSHIWDAFIKNPDEIMKKYQGDQDFISSFGGIDPWPDSWCISYKWHKAWKNIDDTTSIVVFHGKPNPDEAIRGYMEYPPAPWIRNFWR